jgi:hypothetical protein
MDILIDDIISGPLNIYLINMSISSMKISCQRFNKLLKYLTYNNKYDPFKFLSYDLTRIDIDLLPAAPIINNLGKYDKLIEFNAPNISNAIINLDNLPNLTKIHINQTWTLSGKSKSNCLKLNWLDHPRHVDVSQMGNILTNFQRLKVLKLLGSSNDLAKPNRLNYFIHIQTIQIFSDIILQLLV